MKKMILINIFFICIILIFLRYAAATNEELKTLLHYSMKVYYNATIIYFLVANGFYLTILCLGFLEARKKYHEQLTNISAHLSSLKSLKPISILVPCYNEEVSVEASVSSMLRLDYPNFEVIVCNDGSKDRSMEIMMEKFSLKPIEILPVQTLPSKKINAVYRSDLFHNLTVIDKENGGKSDALNAAINYSTFPLICCVDSDSIIDSKGLVNISMPFLESDNVIASGGTVLVANPSSKKIKDKFTNISTTVPSTWLGMIQVVEYLRAFLVGRLGWSYIKCTPIISGAFGLFKKSTVIKAGGYDTTAIGEDMELLLRMQSYCLKEKENYVISLLPIPVCWTEAPSDLKSLRNQRVRWSQGLADCLWKHKDMIFSPWAKSIGMIGLPYFLFFEILAAPLEIIGYVTSIIGISIGVLSWQVILSFLGATVVFGCILNLGAVIIDQITFEKYSRISDLFKVAIGSVLEHFGFRQLHLYWRLQGILQWTDGKHDWGFIRRIGSKASTVEIINQSERKL
jgi:cellulose synthase/poly-beta-1,6-N-acetylglucosamine synthase-like glycosyltransferase